MYSIETQEAYPNGKKSLFGIGLPTRISSRLGADIN